MRRYIFLILGVLACLNLFSQPKCDSIYLSQTDKILLKNFWTEFKGALNNKNKTKLADLCRFPFNCDYCILDSTKESDKPYIEVTKATFDKSQYKIFLNKRLIKKVNTLNMPQDLFIYPSYYRSDDKKCSYSFSYTAIEENEQHPGMQHLFDIENVNGQFKIIGTWTIP